MSVDTLLRKEKDGTLGGYKLAQFYGPIVPFSDVVDKGAARTSASKKPGHIPSREDIENSEPKREDGREFATTLQGPGTLLSDLAPTNPGNDG